MATDDKKKTTLRMSGILTLEMAAVTAGANGSQKWLVAKEDRQMKFRAETVLKAAEAINRAAMVLKSGTPTEAAAEKIDADVMSALEGLAAELPALVGGEGAQQELNGLAESLAASAKKLAENADIRNVDAISQLQADVAKLTATVDTLELAPAEEAAAEPETEDEPAGDEPTAEPAQDTAPEGETADEPSVGDASTDDTPADAAPEATDTPGDTPAPADEPEASADDAAPEADGDPAPVFKSAAEFEAYLAKRDETLVARMTEVFKSHTVVGTFGGQPAESLEQPVDTGDDDEMDGDLYAEASMDLNAIDPGRLGLESVD
jgi:hypothetical protein